MTNTLVSIIVITYNSAKYVLETLQSTKAQTYQNIELIISDDGSTDNTEAICREWLKENNKRFVRTKFITQKINTGIPANCNRGVYAAKGEWIKFIAGDDLLLPECISSFIEFSLRNDAKIIFSRMQSFEIQKGKKELLKIHPYNREELVFTLTPIKQYKYLLTKSFNMAPTSFIKKELIYKVGGFDEDYKYVEDLPLWLKITKSGEQLHFCPAVTVLYRKHQEAITKGDRNFYNMRFKKSLHEMRRKYIYPNVTFYNLPFWNSALVYHLKYYIITHFFKNKKTNKTLKIERLLSFADFIFTAKFIYNKFRTIRD